MVRRYFCKCSNRELEECWLRRWLSFYSRKSFPKKTFESKMRRMPLNNHHPYPLLGHKLPLINWNWNRFDIKTEIYCPSGCANISDQTFKMEIIENLFSFSPGDGFWLKMCMQQLEVIERQFRFADDLKTIPKRFFLWNSRQMGELKNLMNWN